MTIDIQPGDTFTINKGGQPYQWRNGKFRSLFSSDWHTGGSGIDHNGLSRDTFAAIAGWAGHTITEATPAPTPVPWPTHVVVGKINGVVYRMGTKDQCDLWTKETSLSCDSHEVRPLAPAPLSPAMVTLLKSLDGYFRQQPTTAAERINISICALRNESGVA